MKKLKGLAVYCGLADYSIEDNLKYLELIKQHGIDFVFTSAHVDEAQIENEFKVLIEKAKELELELVVDVNKKAYELIKEYEDFCVFRLDYGFSIEEVAMFSNKYKLIELNASTITIDYLNKLKELNANFEHIRVSHNFYPKRYTGLDIFKVKEKNKLFKSFGLTTLGYLPSNSNKRPPLYDGLPSIERHRYLDLNIASYELFAAYCDGICIGDAIVSLDDILTLVNIKSDYYEIPIEVFDNITTSEIECLSGIHRLRIDESPYMKRSSTKRGMDILVNNTISPILPYMVTIDNNNYLRYQGEVAISTLEMENKGFVNVVGKVIADAHTLVDLIDPSAKISFKIVK